MSELTGKVIAITGAASGIGYAAAIHLASRGAKLSLSDASLAALEKVAKDIANSIGTECVFYQQADVRDTSAVETWIGDTVHHFGRLDGAVNAAGVHPKESGTTPIWEVTNDDWQFAQDVNVRGTLNCVRAQLRHMVGSVEAGKMKTGAIVIIGSNSSMVGAPNLSAYTTSKHAVVGLMRAAAMDAAPHNIRVNAVCPGPTDTPMLRKVVPSPRRDAMADSIPLKRLGTAEEVAAVAAFFLSDASAFCTGSIHMVDGGITAA